MEEQQTGSDVERVMHALKREREAHKATTRLLAQAHKDLQRRVEALEARPSIDLASITAGLAAIRSDLRAEVAALRQELDQLEQQLHQFTRG